jgi:amino acid adenylation domain-containing protein
MPWQLSSPQATWAPETFTTGANLVSLPARIAAWALSTPRRTAVADERGSLTFAQLDDQSNHLAWELLEAGVKRETCVGLFFERSTDFVVAALAVIKCGGAYLPLDSATPAARAAAMLADAGAPVVLTHRGKTRDWAPDAWQVLELHKLDGESSTPLPKMIEADGLAYVVYTSGSTGTPKGVEITHGNLLNLIDWHNRAFDVTSADRASQVAGLGFDATAWELWPHLAVGASVHIADEATRRSPQALRDWLVANEITISFLPTVLAEQLMHSDWPAATALRTMLTGADKLHRRPAAGLPFAVVNNYGPSECTVVATSGLVSAAADDDTPPSIGRPIDHCDVLLLDANLQPVPTGEAGELCIAGALVGRGYRNRPDLTAGRFVTITAESGESLRIYRTGDRARWTADGELAFLGRLDDQLKIRGYRIEPGEIVANLDKFSGIEASAVTAIETEAGPTLVAFVVLAANARPSDVDLRAHLAARLPDYMVPAQFVRLDALPLTPNGKLDKAALPAPTDANRLTSPTVAAAAPSAAGNIADQLAALVAQLLERPSIAHTDNFFLLGGHSMLAAQLMARIADLFGVKLSLRQLFSSPTVVALAAEIVRRKEQARG